MAPFLFIAWRLDKGELGFEAGDEGFLFCDGIFGFFNEVFRGAFDVVWIHHALVQSIQFATDG